MGLVTLHTPRKRGYMSVYLKTDLDFVPGDEVLIAVTEEKITITKPTLDNVKKTATLTMGFCPTFRTYTTDWRDASYLIDEEESDEDQIVIYREDIILTEEEEEDE